MKEADKYSDKFVMCEWCGCIYPQNSMQFRSIIVFTSKHHICEDCYRHLKPVEELGKE